MLLINIAERGENENEKMKIKRRYLTIKRIKITK